SGGQEIGSGTQNLRGCGRTKTQETSSRKLAKLIPDRENNRRRAPRLGPERSGTPPPYLRGRFSENSPLYTHRPSKAKRKTQGWDFFSLSECYVLIRSEEHTSELQSRGHIVCRLLLE